MGNPGKESPLVTLCTCHPGSHAPVYFYEFQHSPSFMKDFRPSHVRADHGDEIPFLFRSTFFGTKGEASSFPRMGMQQLGVLRGCCAHCTDDRAEAQMESSTPSPTAPRAESGLHCEYLQTWLPSLLAGSDECMAWVQS